MAFVDREGHCFFRVLKSDDPSSVDEVFYTWPIEHQVPLSFGARSGFDSKMQTDFEKRWKITTEVVPSSMIESASEMKTSLAR